MLGWASSPPSSPACCSSTGVFHRKAHSVGFREAATWSLVWIVLALAFAGVVWWSRGRDDALLFTTSWMVEWSLSLDNIFVFMVIFTYFQVPDRYRHRLLFFGILGSVVLARAVHRGRHRHHPALRLGHLRAGRLPGLHRRQAGPGARRGDSPERNPVLRLFRRLFPVATGYGEGRFFVREAGRALATPLFVVLLVVETTDVVFAVDSVPAVLAITNDPFLVYTSNVFAILGLRSLYFALSGTMAEMRFLNYGLAAILSFVGAKMLLAGLVHVPPLVSLAVIGVLLGASIAASLLFPESTEPRQ